MKQIGIYGNLLKEITEKVLRETLVSFIQFQYNATVCTLIMLCFRHIKAQYVSSLRQDREGNRINIKQTCSPILVFLLFHMQAQQEEKTKIPAPSVQRFVNGSLLWLTGRVKPQRRQLQRASQECEASESKATGTEQSLKQLGRRGNQLNREQRGAGSSMLAKTIMFSLIFLMNSGNQTRGGFLIAEIWNSLKLYQKIQTFFYQQTTFLKSNLGPCLKLSF